LRLRWASATGIPSTVRRVCVGFAHVLPASTAVAVPVFPGAVDAAQSMLTLAGHVMTGAVTSVIVMICTQVDAFPHPSVAVQVLVIT